MRKTQVAVIGGGPAGLMAAGRAHAMGRQVLLFEQNPILGKKLLITGKGRCNVTNGADISEFFPMIVKNRNFLYSAFYSFTNEDVIRFFEERGVALKVERGQRVFPATDRSNDILSALKAYTKEVPVIHQRVTSIEAKDGKIIGVKIASGEVISCESVVLATGGISYPGTGSRGDGFTFAKQLGHTVTELKPALVPLTTAQNYGKDLAGLTLKNIAVLLKDEKGKKIYEDFGELLFTHHGISGPVVLSASAHVKDGQSHTFHIDLKPALSEDKLEKRILADFEKYKNKNFSNALDDLLPRKLIPVIIERSGISPEAKVNAITKEERKKLLALLKDFSLTISGKGDPKEAIITDGGISVKELSPSTMESKLVAGLFFAGEIIDVHAYTGGYNLQIAFSTGYLAGEHA